MFEIPMNSPAIDELAGRRQWVCHKKKIPICPANGKPASSTSPLTWGSYDEAIQEAVQLKHSDEIDGVGYVFTEADPYVGIDLDKCVDEDQKIQEWAQKIITRLDSYTEFSPSGKGVHIFIKGFIPGNRNRTGHLEIYSRGRYFTVTGHHLEDSPETINERQGELEEIYTEYFSDKGKPENETPDDSWVDLKSKLNAEKLVSLVANNVKFRKSWEHDRSDLSDQSLSSYDLSLSTIAAYAEWTKEEIIALIISHRSKYGETVKAYRKDYLARVIDKAMSAKRDGIKDSDVVENESMDSAKESGKEEILSEISSQIKCSIFEGMHQAGPGLLLIYYFLIDGKATVLIGESLKN